MTTVGDLRRILNGILDQLAGLGDDEVVEVQPNTFGMGMTVLGVWDGFIDYSEPIEIEREEEDEEEEEE